MVAIGVLRLVPEAVLPQQAHEDDAGFDLSTIEPVVLAPGARARVHTGIALEIPAGTCGFVLPRSGLAFRNGVTVLNAPGLIDAGYRGEVMVLLVNHGDADVAIKAGDRIAQLVIVSLEAVAFTEVLEISSSERSDGGFGHTGR
ncbi:MAG: dUTP diphosphatase [Ferrimicrobium sp.]